MNDPISPPLRQFILDNIETVADLEGLLLLRREPRCWDVAALARELYVGEPVAKEVLVRLEGLGLVSSSDGNYRYEPKSPEQAAMVDALAQTYARALIPVTHLVHNNPRRLRRFADAFKFRKDS